MDAPNPAMTPWFQIGSQWRGVGDPCRSTLSNMKAMKFLIIAVLLGITQAIALPLQDELVRQPGDYSLDDKGSALVITKRTGVHWSFAITWRSGSFPGSISSDDYLRAEGWFIFVEKPNRVWVFDGIDDGHLLTSSDRTVSEKSFSGGLKGACPKKVWDALPEAMRTKYRNVEPNAPGNSR